MPLSEAKRRNLEALGKRLRKEGHILDLSGASLPKFALEGKDVSGAIFEGSELAVAKFADSGLRRTRLDGANLSNADLRRADARGASFVGADFRGTNLKGTDLRGADLTNAKNLTFDQIKLAIIDESTILPAVLRERLG